ncbi:MAG: hypothetical protein GY940_08515 [bacterium]|nr:hypothetical protein [bacterium]
MIMQHQDSQLVLISSKGVRVAKKLLQTYLGKFKPLLKFRIMENKLKDKEVKNENGIQ